ncbi:MAG: hypothetical protein NTY39_05170 [Campylobacterales bacterium]|nr:hypothetical protein [Campylobacterales bacterium]
MSDETSSRRNFLETLAGFIVLSIVVSIILGNKTSYTPPPPYPDMEKLLQASKSIASLSVIIFMK